MDKMDLAVTIIVLFFLSLVVIMCVVEDRSDETEQIRYKDNLVINDMSIETYNKSYNELTHEQKEQMIRWYRISEHTNQKNNYVPFIVPIPT